MTDQPTYVIGSFADSRRGITHYHLCERCGQPSTRMCRVYLAPYDPLARRTPTYWWCIPCAFEMGAKEVPS